MARPETVERVAAVTATLHDGRNMIVLNEGKTVTVAKSSVPFLENKRALVPQDAKGTSEAPAQSDDIFDIPDGYTLTEKGGGWYEIAGPEGFDPVKAQGSAKVREELAKIAEADKADAPADAGDSGGANDGSGTEGDGGKGGDELPDVTQLEGDALREQAIEEGVDYAQDADDEAVRAAITEHRTAAGEGGTDGAADDAGAAPAA